MSAKIAIDSLSDLVDHIIQHAMTEESRIQLASMQETGLHRLHLGPALSIRNRYILIDQDKVPQLIQQYWDDINNVHGSEEFDRMEYTNKQESDNETTIAIQRMFDEYMYMNPDAMSNYLCRLIWSKLRS